MELTIEVARKVLSVVDAGLVKGLGQAEPGKMCVEAAVCYALGLPHGDEPICVGESVRRFKIGLNDKAWSSNEARAKGLRRVAIAQLGSDKIDQAEFRKHLVIGVVQKLLPIAFRAAGSLIPAHRDALEAAALVCEGVVTLAEARTAALAGKTAAADADAAAYAANAAANAAYANAAYAAYAAYAASAASADAADAAYAASADAAYAAADAASAAAAYAASVAYAAAGGKRIDEVLSIAAEIAVQALIKCGSKGCEWLELAPL